MDQTQIQQIFAGNTDLVVDIADEEFAECGAIMQESEGVYSYPILYSVDEKGIWKIREF